MKVLDLGCGNAATLKKRSAEFAGYDLYGVDIDAVALNAAAQAMPEAHFERAPAENLPFPDGMFDSVISGVAIPYMDIPRAFLEVARVSTDSARFEFTYHPLQLVWRYFVASVIRGTPKAAIFYAYALLNGVLFFATGRVFPFFYYGRFESFQTVRGLRIALKRAGFVIVRTRGGSWRPGDDSMIIAAKTQSLTPLSSHSSTAPQEPTALL
jgi:SAM-dependent methyltransferase